MFIELSNIKTSNNTEGLIGRILKSKTSNNTEGLIERILVSQYKITIYRNDILMTNSKTVICL